MTHVAEERDIEAPPEVIWAIISDSMRWPEFYRTHDYLGVLNAVRYIEGERDALGTTRHMDFRISFSWDETCVRFDPPRRLDWEGVRTPGMKYYLTQLELIPGEGYTTLRWDLYYRLTGLFGFLAAKRVRRVLEDVVLTSLLEIDRIAMGEKGTPA